MYKDLPPREKRSEGQKEFNKVVHKVRKARRIKQASDTVEELMRNPEAREKFGPNIKNTEFPRMASHGRLVDALALEVLNRKGMNRRKMFTQLTQTWGMVPSDAYAFLDAEYANVRSRAKELRQLRDS